MIKMYNIYPLPSIYSASLTCTGLSHFYNCFDFRLEHHKRADMFGELKCSSPVSGTKFLITDTALLDSLECGQTVIEVGRPVVVLYPRVNIFAVR